MVNMKTSLAFPPPPPIPPPAAAAAAMLMQCLKPHIQQVLRLLALVPSCLEDIGQVLKEDTLSLTKSANQLVGNHLIHWHNPLRRNVLVTTMFYPVYSSVTPPFSVSCSPNVSSTNSDSSSAAESTETFERGPAFFGHVFSMWDASESGLLGVWPFDGKKRQIKLPPFVPGSLWKLLKEALPGLFQVKVQEPVFRFYIDKVDAEEYVKDVGLPGSIVASLPLDAAYKIYKENSSMFSFIANKKQVKLAKQVIKKFHGQKEALNFDGVPVFSTRNLTLCLLTSRGMKWFRPYFFDKRRLDVLIGSSVDQYYKMLIRTRQMQRHSQENDTDLFSELAEDDLEPLEPLEVQEFMEELGHSGFVFDSALVKSVNVCIQDMMDNLIFANKWSRQLVGIQPCFPVHVESFQKRAAAAELQDNKSTAAQDGTNASSSRNEPSQSKFGRKDVAVTSPASTDRTSFSDKSQKVEFNHTIESTQGHKKLESKQESTELQLTIMGFASYGLTSSSDMSTIMKDLSAAVDDMESSISQTDRQNKELNPIFITDMRLPGEVRRGSV
ncbi:hypothetical protein O6H91_02G147600 [Diphasiastrum complanatum]|uniref:Uncharacterized protein n=1 Tax=Diphasiastrum complanatum TaxID=34168 RepID=A0ACC2EM33_DIPCM|nr:hypothetical protein O6H91_02G147600 [Diphasiastrum complanatum]